MNTFTLVVVAVHVDVVWLNKTHVNKKALIETNYLSIPGNKTKDDVS